MDTLCYNVFFVEKSVWIQATINVNGGLLPILTRDMSLPTVILTDVRHSRFMGSEFLLERLH